MPLEWTRSETLALAQQSCASCHGLGLRPGRAGKSAPCNCVFRAIFRVCYKKFRLCLAKDKHISRVSLETTRSSSNRQCWGMKDEEYAADFCLVTKRVLQEKQHRIFRFHFLLGADWKICCQKLKMERGHFFHEVYRIEQKLGRTFRELEPHPLFPVDEYFNGTRGCAKVHPIFTIDLPTEDYDEEEDLPYGKQKLNNLLAFPIRRAAGSGD